MSVTINNSVGKVCTGESLTGEIHFIDYLNPKSEKIWMQPLDDLNQKMDFFRDLT